jgi:peptidoglycan L-alanyl-D-glutamate endopeptidase CwlK
MPYTLSLRSKTELVGVHPDLVRVVEKAIQITTQDFGVHDGLRTMREQEEYIAKGASRTRNSKHLKQPDGFGHAVDLVPYINGKLRWEWGAIWPIARAVRMASAEQGVSLIWGGVWDRRLGDLDLVLQDAVEEYCKRHPGPDFLDGPHYQLAGR